MNSDISIRPFDTADIGFALQQTGREGWDSTPVTFEMLLAHDPDGSFVAEFQGRPAGMVTTTRYADSAWIGNLIVPPEFRKMAIGSLLMEHGIKHLEQQGSQCIRLEADPLGVNIYRRLGFIDEFESPRFRIEKYDVPFPAGVAKLATGDLDQARDLDRILFGDDRGRMLQLLHKNAVYAFQVSNNGKMLGFVFVQQSTAGYRLGPWVADSTKVAGDLLAAALSSTALRPVIVALPGINENGMSLLSQFGFFQTPSSLRMVRGKSPTVGHFDRIYGLANGAIG